MGTGVCVCVCIPHACGVPRGHNGMLDPLNLELEMVVHCHVSARTQTWVPKEQPVISNPGSFCLFV